VAFPRSIKRTCRRFLVRATNHGDRAVRAVEHSVANRTEQQSGDPAAATGTDDQQRGVLGCFDQCHGWTLFDRLLNDGHGRVLLPDLGQRLGQYRGGLLLQRWTGDVDHLMPNRQRRAEPGQGPRVHRLETGIAQGGLGEGELHGALRRLRAVDTNHDVPSCFHVELRAECAGHHNDRAGNLLRKHDCGRPKPRRNRTAQPARPWAAQSRLASRLARWNGSVPTTGVSTTRPIRTVTAAR